MTETPEPTPEDPAPQPQKTPTWWERLDQWFRRRKPAPEANGG